jgi:hypothetical protein
VRFLAPDDREPPVSRPWPVSRSELRGFIQAGLREAEFTDQPAVPPHGRFFTAVYTQPGLRRPNIPANEPLPSSRPLWCGEGGNAYEGLSQTSGAATLQQVSVARAHVAGLARRR